MSRGFLCLSLLLSGGICLCLAGGSRAAEKTPAERGREIMFSRSLNPPLWPQKAYESVWKQWGLSEKPANFTEAFMERYGLHQAPFDNKGRPMGLIEAQGLLSKGIVNNCLLCHAGRVAGQTIIGVGNASVDLQSLFEELSAAGFVYASGADAYAWYDAYRFVVLEELERCDAERRNALLESVASEMGSRMTAMDSASKNASEVIDRLTLNMNRVRQAAITREIIEVVSGAEAL